MTLGQPTSSANRIAASLFLLCLCWFGWFLTPNPNWNILSRADLASSIVLDHKIDIDRYRANTGDMACIGGHFYSDKAPGSSWLALPALTHFSFSHVVDPKNTAMIHRIMFFTVAIPAAFLVTLLFLFCLKATGDHSVSLFCAMSYAFGTIAFPYSTLFISHQPAALIMFIIFLMSWSIRNGGSVSLAGSLLAGFLFGALFTIEFQLLLPGAALMVYYVFSASRANVKKFIAHSSAAAAACIIPVACWIAYNYLVFGRPIDFAYSYECIREFREGMTRGLGAFTIPEPKVLYELFLFPGRGLFAVSPFLLLAAPGLYRMFKLGRKAESILFIAVILLVSALNITVYQPSGGAAPGPRYLIPMLPFCAAAAAFFLKDSKRVWLHIGIGVAIVSAAHMFAFVVTNPQPPRGLMSPLAAHNLPMIIDGYIRPSLAANSPRAGYFSLAAPAAISCLLLAFSYIETLKSANASARRSVSGTASAIAIALIVFSCACFVLEKREASKRPAINDLAIADTYLLLGRTDLAVKRYSESLKAEPFLAVRKSFDELTEYCLSSLFYQKDYSQAESCFNMILKHQPENLKALIGLSEVRRIRGDDPGPLLDDAERIMGNRPDDMMLVGYARLGAGQPCAALRIARKALAEHPAFEAAKKLLAETSGKCKTDTER